MQRVGEFEKVSFEQFYGAMKDEFGIGETEAKMMYDLIDIPKRSTVGSAGYDFMSPVSVTLAPGASAKSQPVSVSRLTRMVAVLRSSEWAWHQVPYAAR